MLHNIAISRITNILGSTNIWLATIEVSLTSFIQWAVSNVSVSFTLQIGPRNAKESEKLLDLNADHSQNLTDLSLGHAQLNNKVSWKLVDNFLSNLVNR